MTKIGNYNYIKLWHSWWWNTRGHQKPLQEGPEATIVLPVIENNHQMTTRAKSRADFQVERVTTEEQKTFHKISYENMQQTAC